MLSNTDLRCGFVLPNIKKYEVGMFLSELGVKPAIPEPLSLKIHLTCKLRGCESIRHRKVSSVDQQASSLIEMNEVSLSMFLMFVWPTIRGLWTVTLH